MHKVMHAHMNGPVALEPSSNIFSCPPCGWWPRAGRVATSGSGGHFASLVAMVFALTTQLVQWPLPAFLFPLFHRRWTAELVHKLEVGLRVKIHRGRPTLLHELAPLVAHLRQACGTQRVPLLVKCDTFFCEAHAQQHDNSKIDACRTTPGLLVVPPLTTRPPPPPPATLIGIARLLPCHGSGNQAAHDFSWTGTADVLKLLLWLRPRET